MLKKDISKLKIHFIGIGGIGISGLAKYLKAQGAKISGSDIAEGSAISYLRSIDVPVTIPHNKIAITDQDIVIHSAIIKEENPEIIEAKNKNIPVLSRKEALEFILCNKRVFSICGAHGKSTTSAMLSAIFRDFGAIIGADTKEYGSNVREIQSESIVFEADESDRSFLNSNPYCAIVTNAEPEHMESYNHDLETFYNAYREFLNSASRCCINIEDPFLRTLDMEAKKLSPSKDIKNITYVLKNDEPYTHFELLDLGEFEVWGFGEHTACNASLAILAALDEMDIQTIRNNLKNFKGIKKRFDIIQKGDLILIDDYAHHPTEIVATLNSVKTYATLKGRDKITVIWQPHKYSRLLDNLKGFQECFSAYCDELIILPIWKAGEEHIELDMNKLFGHYKPIFADKIKKKGTDVEVFAGDGVIKTIKDGIVVGFGAGDITYQLRGIK
ncbi:UDP-N-acetylmuramate--L-alanine ligase [Helicobacter cappadocius]|uniref:UDP-N-acetylmuramate--L-alanine ligase n=1 Tax=Helicobacter cappadocius TaxID=3063998 RepID=A0AA90PQF5_9HELI|nr:MULTISPECIES: UDP-N-acetylmuramate--L-alanine ligase [unclassified Helicobacter]MDO7252798.1 UDP-N-acetylmuramate--L-alanine ligase [Helicobacter sp. faydin-H75]MDP2538841.1 UDP-N-acetylmuramate--L-alanine ligase [Helicobacter sp. faydin-H76]